MNTDDHSLQARRSRRCCVHRDRLRRSDEPPRRRCGHNRAGRVAQRPALRLAVWLVSPLLPRRGRRLPLVLPPLAPLGPLAPLVTRTVAGSAKRALPGPRQYTRCQAADQPEFWRDRPGKRDHRPPAPARGPDEWPAWRPGRWVVSRSKRAHLPGLDAHRARGRRSPRRRSPSPAPFWRSSGCPVPRRPAGHHVLGVPFVLGAVTFMTGRAEWARSQRALRRGEPLPCSAHRHRPVDVPRWSGA